MGYIKEINIKNQNYYFFDDMTNIEDFDPNLLKIDKKSCKNINIYYIGYITMKDSNYVKIKSVYPFHLSYLPSLLPFTVSISFLIPFQSFVYFFNTSLFLSAELKIKYLLPFFSLKYPLL